MKKTPVSSRPSLISASSGHVNKSRNATVKARFSGSPSSTASDFKGVSSRNANALLDTQTPTGVKDRLLQKCQQELEARFSGSPSSTASDFKGVSSRNANALLDTQTPTGVKDRLLQKCQQELEQLKRENCELKAELLFIRSLYKQIVEEVPVEKYDERRVNLLKSQVIQLERQVLLQSSALQARRNVFLQVENKLLNLKETLRSLHSSDDSSNYITVSREYVRNLEFKVEGARLDLYKSKENMEIDDLSLPAIYLGNFLKQSKSAENQPTTLLDCCSGKAEHLNLKQVSRLESKLCKLYKNMACLDEMLQLKPSSTSAVLTSEHISQPIRDRLASHVTTVTDMLRDCCEDLLSISVLYPAAPWPPLKKAIQEDLTEDNVMSHMPDLSRKKQQEVRSVVQALMKSFSYSKHVLSLEVKILKEELSFHRQVYECQTEYAESLLSAVSEAYRTFERNLIELLCKPLEEILNGYRKLKDTALEDDLRNFLSTFKDHATQLSEATVFLQPHKQEDDRGLSALSEFHTHFTDSLHSLTRKCVAERDMLMKQLLEAKDGGLSGEASASTANNETLNTSEYGQGLDQSHQTNT